MEGGALVAEALLSGAESSEVLAGLGSHVGPQLHDEATQGGQVSRHLEIYPGGHGGLSSSVDRRFTDSLCPTLSWRVRERDKNDKTWRITTKTLEITTIVMATYVQLYMKIHIHVQNIYNKVNIPISSLCFEEDFLLLS